MHAQEKVAWIEVIASSTSLILAAALYPFCGQAALSAFAILGVMGVSPWFLKKHDDQVVTDERDQNIDLRSRFWGFGIGWMVMLMSLIALQMWHGYQKIDVPTIYLNVLIWFQFALCFGIKGVYSLLCYRGGRSAA